MLTALAVVLALTAGVFTVLYLGERAERDGVAATRADRERVLADVREQQEGLDAALATNKSREATLISENDLLATCVEAARTYFDLPPGRSDASSQVFAVMYDVCPQL
ncbi:hypothetical protein [Saccharothrix sp. HUAS TT1]|uniref:hypothetical protein n=1 Tax=unclassified Saccharothrix TaxID=2593673 RepID=UPI00345C1D15